MKNKKIIIAILFLIFMPIIWNFFGKMSKTVKVGSKNFTENLIVAEIYSLALEDAGIKVDRVFNISSALIHESIISGKVDLYPEYTGTGLLSILKEEMETDPWLVYDIVKTKYKQKYNIVWLDYAPANDGQGLVIKTDVAKEYDIKTISDLQEKSNLLRFASQGEFELREDGIKGLEKTYGKFDWKSSKIFDNSLKYTVLENGQADVTPAYTTEAQLTNRDKFTLLVDDKNFWPPYNLAPIVRGEILENGWEIANILNAISNKLDTETLTALNAMVDIEGMEYQEVAKKFYDKIR